MCLLFRLYRLVRLDRMRDNRPHHCSELVEHGPNALVPLGRDEETVRRRAYHRGGNVRLKDACRPDSNLLRLWLARQSAVKRVMILLVLAPDAIANGRTRYAGLITFAILFKAPTALAIAPAQMLALSCFAFSRLCHFWLEGIFIAIKRNSNCFLALILELVAIETIATLTQCVKVFTAAEALTVELQTLAF